MAHRTTNARIARAALLAAVTSLAASAPTGAQAVGSATPNQAGAGTQLHWAVDGTLDPVARRIPSALTMRAPAGFTLDRRAMRTRCKPLEARLDECPSQSRIGSALMTIRVFKPAGPDDLPVEIDLYAGRGDDVMAVAFLAGTRVVPGRVTDADGIEVVFDPLPVPPEIPTVSYEFLGVTVDLGATRRVTVGRKPRKGRRGKRKRRGARKTERVALVRAPGECPPAGWAATARLDFPDGTSATMPAPMACAG